MHSTNTDMREFIVINVPLRLTPSEFATLGSQRQRFAAASAKASLSLSSNLVERAKWLYRFEQKRRELPVIGSLLGDPSWMILLDLFIRGGEGQTTSVSSATLASGAPLTTGLRHVVILETKGYIERRKHPADNRSVNLSLTEYGRSAVASVLEHLSLS